MYFNEMYVSLLARLYRFSYYNYIYFFLNTRCILIIINNNLKKKFYDRNKRYFFGFTCDIFLAQNKVGHRILM